MKLNEENRRFEKKKVDASLGVEATPVSFTCQQKGLQQFG